MSEGEFWAKLEDAILHRRENDTNEIIGLAKPIIESYIDALRGELASGVAKEHLMPKLSESELREKLAEVLGEFVGSIDGTSLKWECADDILAIVNPELDALRGELTEWKRAIEGLTPSGSEFVNDPKACAAYIRKRTEYPRMIIDLRGGLAEAKRYVKHLEGREKELMAKLARNPVCSHPMACRVEDYLCEGGAYVYADTKTHKDGSACTSHCTICEEIAEAVRKATT